MFRPTIRQESLLPKHVPSTDHGASQPSRRQKKRLKILPIALLLMTFFAPAFFYIGYKTALTQFQLELIECSINVISTDELPADNKLAVIFAAADDDDDDDDDDDARSADIDTDILDHGIPSPSIHQHQPIQIKRPICSSARHIIRDDDEMAALRKAYLEAEEFHNNGGNLKQIGTYLNSHIDDTFRMLNVKFTPQVSDSDAAAPTPLDANESMTAKVKELLQSKDVRKLGGYDQRHLPGYFATNEYNEQMFNTARGQRAVDVTEPFNMERWNTGLGPIADVCKSLDIIGGGRGKKHEDKSMCSFDELKIRTENHNVGNNKDKETCEIISIGHDGQWGFEKTISETTNCITHTFDCTVEDPQKPDVKSIKFYPNCISGTQNKIGKPEYLSYSQIIKQIGITKPPALFKMDVEGFEYDRLIEMIDEAVTSGSTDLLPSQISVELHYSTRMYDIPWMLRFLQASEIAMFMGIMYRRGGYVPVNVENLGPWCRTCVEVVFVRIFCD